MSSDSIHDAVLCAEKRGRTPARSIDAALLLSPYTRNCDYLIINAVSLRHYLSVGKFADAGKLYSQIDAQNPKAYSLGLGHGHQQIPREQSLVIKVITSWNRENHGLQIFVSLDVVSRTLAGKRGGQIYFLRSPRQAPYRRRI